MKKQLLSILLLAGIFLPASKCSTNQYTEKPISIEYFLRKTNAEFKKEASLFNLLIPSAQAELPPQYWRLFSLFIQFNHHKRELDIEWFFKNNEDNTTEHAQKIYGEKHYVQVIKLLHPNNTCIKSVERGMVGPSPEYITIIYPQKNLSFYAREVGYDGPGQDLSQQSKSRYLCSKPAKQLLQFFRSDIVKK